MESVKTVKAGEKYKPKVYKTKQLEFGDEVRILDDEMFPCVPADRLLNRWVLTNKIIPVVFIPFTYSSERKRFEFLKQPIFTRGGLLRVSSYPPVFEHYERNPTSDREGYVTIVGDAVRGEFFNQVVSVVDIFSADNDILVSLSKDGKEFGEYFVLRGSINESISLGFSCKAILLENLNKDGSHNGKYQVIGYW